MVLVLAMVNHPNGAYSQPASSTLLCFSRKVRDGRFWPIEQPQKWHFFRKKLYGEGKKYLKSEFHGRENLSESFLDVFKTTDKNLKNV